jgi:PST family polysaccharide transporter
MSDHDFRRRVSRGVAWIGAASGAVGLLDVVTLILLIKFWVTREQFGIASLAVTLFPILDLVADLGLTGALVARPDSDRDHADTIFWLNLALSVALFALLFAIAPAAFQLSHGQPLAGWLLVAYGSKLIFQNFYVVPWALMRRELRFKELSIIRVVANVAEMGLKIGFAWKGMPIWCFVLGPIGRYLVMGVGVQLCHPWRPRLVCRIESTRGHIGFGAKTASSQLLYHFYTNIHYQVVAYFFGEASLGTYRIAQELVLYPVKYISEIITSIALSAFARLRTRVRELTDQFLTFTRQNLALVCPFLALILVGAEDLLTVFFEPSAEGAMVARILCVAGLLRGLSHIFPPLLDGAGYPGITLIYTLVASVLMPIAYVLFAWLLGPLGFQSVAIAWAVAYPVAFAVLAWLGLRRVELSWSTYLRRVGGIPVCALMAMVPAWSVRWLMSSHSPGLRLSCVTLVLLVTFGVLLAFLVGISPRMAIASLRERPPPEDGRS